LNRLWFRSAAASCALTSCALAGPGLAGLAVAHADLFGIDFCGHDDKSELHHPRPGSEVSAQSTRVASVAADEAPMAKIGSAPESLAGPAESVAAPRSAATTSALGVADAVVAPGGGGGAVPRAATIGRAPDLPRVSTAPSTRSVIVRRLPSSSPATGSATPAPMSPAAALSAPAPEVGEVEGRPAPAGPPAPVPVSPWPSTPVLPGPGEAHATNAFRAGYAEYLRTADTGDLIAAALPGAAGIAGFTLVGAYAGYRQAKALQKALVAPAPTSILL
jgi:hypothetical protein